MSDILDDIQKVREILNAAHQERNAWAEKLATRIAGTLPPSLQVSGYSGFAMADAYGDGFRCLIIRTSDPRRCVTVAFHVDSTRTVLNLALIAKRMAKKALYAPRRTHER